MILKKRVEVPSRVAGAILRSGEWWHFRKRVVMARFVDGWGKHLKSSLCCQCRVLVSRKRGTVVNWDPHESGLGRVNARLYRADGSMRSGAESLLKTEWRGNTHMFVGLGR